jgi:hypothetical protein
MRAWRCDVVTVGWDTISSAWSVDDLAGRMRVSEAPACAPHTRRRWIRTRWRILTLPFSLAQAHSPSAAANRYKPTTTDFTSV